MDQNHRQRIAVMCSCLSKESQGETNVFKSSRKVLRQFNGIGWDKFHVHSLSYGILINIFF